jgi:hypothetical protein
MLILCVNLRGDDAKKTVEEAFTNNCQTTVHALRKIKIDIYIVKRNYKKAKQIKKIRRPSFNGGIAHCVPILYNCIVLVFNAS